MSAPLSATAHEPQWDVPWEVQMERAVDPLAWVRRLRDDCWFTEVPFFFKQWGGATAKDGGRVLDGEIA